MRFMRTCAADKVPGQGGHSAAPARATMRFGALPWMAVEYSSAVGGHSGLRIWAVGTGFGASNNFLPRLPLRPSLGLVSASFDSLSMSYKQQRSVTELERELTDIPSTTTVDLLISTVY